VTVSDHDRSALAALDARIRAILPPEYQDSYQDVQPVSMGSAGLKYSSDGRVAWDLIWGSFCDLAMAGGPPHKGTLLEPGSAAEIAAQPGRYDEVTGEICRGITMTTGLTARPAPDAGWVRIDCGSLAMASWLLRAIVMENVSARSGGRLLDLPAAPHFQLHKEIKNVVTVIAKTCHYWMGHMSRSQQREIGELLSGLSADAALITPAVVTGEPTAFAAMAEAIHQRTGLVVPAQRYAGWLGVECGDVPPAVWMMRALVVNNILSRREGTTLFVPVNAVDDPGGEGVVNCLVRIHALAGAAGVHGVSNDTSNGSP
jgi:sirohydrochlorin cobaltochelatase